MVASALSRAVAKGNDFHMYRWQGQSSDFAGVLIHGGDGHTSVVKQKVVSWSLFF